MLTPEWYTEKEFGAWTRCPKGWVFSDFPLLNQRNFVSVTIKGYQVHAIAFDDPILGHGNFLRWDCVNGFNQRNSLIK